MNASRSTSCAGQNTCASASSRARGRAKRRTLRVEPTHSDSRHMNGTRAGRGGANHFAARAGMHSSDGKSYWCRANDRRWWRESFAATDLQCRVPSKECKPRSGCAPTDSVIAQARRSHVPNDPADERSEGRCGSRSDTHVPHANERRGFRASIFRERAEPEIKSQPRTLSVSPSCCAPSERARNSRLPSRESRASGPSTSPRTSEAKDAAGRAATRVFRPGTKKRGLRASPFS